MSALPIPTVEVTSRDGLRLIADISGPEHAPTVILLHGGGQTRHSWSAAVRSLASAGYRVVNFDARGHGDSEWSRSAVYSLDARADDLEAVAALAKGRFALVGASLGGATGIHAVARGLKPEALILVDIVPEPEMEGVERIVSFMRSHPNGFATLDDAAEAVAAYNPHRPRPSDPSGLRRNLREQADGRLHWHWDPRTVDARPDDIHAVVLKSAQTLARMETPPVLLVRGLNSDVVSDRAVARFARMMPRLQVLDITGAGHMVAGDRNDRFNAGVFAHLQRHLPLATRGR